MFLRRSWSWRTILDCKMPSSPDTLLVQLAECVEVEKVTNHTALWNTELTWYSRIVTRQICRGREGDKPHCTVRCWTLLMLSQCYSPDLPRSWRWKTILHCEIPSSPDTLELLRARFAEVEKVTNHTALWGAELAWCFLSAARRICRGREGDKPHRIVKYRARLILSNFYSLDLPRSRRWQTTLHCEIPSSPDTLELLRTRFAEVVKVTNHTGLWDAETAGYSPIATL